MNALRTALILALLSFAPLASHAEGTATDGKNKAKTSAAAPVRVRKEVAAFVDPTAPLANLVEQVRAERAQQAAMPVR